MTISAQNVRLSKFAAAAALLVAMTVSGLTEELKYKPISVKTPDGLTIAAQEWGNPAGPEILFIHGFSQSSMSWMRQVDSDLAKEFRIVTYDLRGHGNSDKPLDPARYRDSKAWGDEVQAVIDAAGLKRPVLVGWSYAGRVISDYVATQGAGKLAGINFVDASIKADPALFGGDGVRGWVGEAGETLCQGFALRIEQCCGACAGDAIDRLLHRHGVGQCRHHNVLDDQIVIAAAVPMGIAIAFDEACAFGEFDREFGGARGRLHDQPQPRLDRLLLLLEAECLAPERAKLGERGKAQVAGNRAAIDGHREMEATERRITMCKL